MSDQINTQNPVSQALREAENIINGAKERAQEILFDTEKSAETIKSKAYLEGVNFGKKEIVSASLKFIRDHEVLSKKLQREASLLAFEIIKKVFNYEDKSIIDPIQQLAKKLLESSGAERSITLITHPNNSHRIRAVASEISSLNNLKFTLKESTDLSHDTLVMRSELGEVQVSLSDLLTELASFLNIKSAS